MSYDPETGIFRWLKTKGRRITGNSVGSLHSGGYFETQIDNHRCFLHRLAWFYMTGYWPEKEVDHINGDRTDNKYSNLRLADRQQNAANQKMRDKNKSGYKGVVFDVKAKVYRSYIHVNYRTRYLGTFACPEQAHKAYCKAAQEVWGDRARSQ